MDNIIINSWKLINMQFSICSQLSVKIDSPTLWIDWSKPKGLSHAQQEVRTIITHFRLFSCGVHKSKMAFIEVALNSSHNYLCFAYRCVVGWARLHFLFSFLLCSFVIRLGNDKPNASNWRHDVYAWRGFELGSVGARCNQRALRSFCMDPWFHR